MSATVAPSTRGETNEEQTGGFLTHLGRSVPHYRIHSRGYSGVTDMSKGSRREREAVELLKQAGYATYRPATVRFGENDMWGLFDVMTIAPDKPMRAIQVKSNRAVGIKKWARHTALWRRYGYVTEYWVPVDNRGWRIIECTNAGRYDAVDEREETGVFGDSVVEYLEGEA